MERLTEKHYLGTDHYMKCSGSCNVDIYCIDCPSFDRLVERLAAYEETGLTPKEVSTLVKDWSDLRTIVGECGGLDRVRALAEADRAGRLVVLPCKVGDTVWAILGDKKYACKCIVEYVNIGGRGLGTTIVLCEAEGLREQYGVTVAAFGKTVFLTREEAERALEAKKNE